ncbi:DUF3710 domain-containing protein [Ornithinimicrobium sediminis]|uniref:DUF3710 domain-containing protein n=1 Tax=Ornithinimicrobium sediminis TaxID=2904603 RepID=UPI001E314B63|nr:DUF3710 domain-containing protein [Ornithinimicrobium sediminis]
MGIFGKRKQITPDLGDDSAEAEVDVPEGEPGVDRDWERAVDGPFDVSERPDAEGYLDLGALRVPPRPGMELRLEIEQGTQRMVGVTCGVGDNKVQLQAFAAPRSSGIWTEIRSALSEGIVQAGGSAQTADGVFGDELRARMPGRAADGRVAYQPARFMGVDGPRWFLRVVVNGPAATDEEALREVLTFVRGVVVDRGDEPRPPRELLELRAPQNVVDAAARRARAAQGDEPQGDQPQRQPPAGQQQDPTEQSGSEGRP